MDYLFRLADGRRLALWSERNQIIRQLSGGGGNRSHITMRSDFLSDLSAVSVSGRIYFVYQNTARMVMLYLPDAEEDLLLFGESIESCRHSDLTLAVWEDGLYLFYIGWSPIRERYFLKVRKLAISRLTVGEVREEGAETVLAQEFTELPEYRLIQEKNGLTVLSGELCWRMCIDEAGETVWSLGKWAEKDRIERWRLAEETVEEMQSKLKEEQEKTGSLRESLEEEQEKTGLLRKILEEKREKTGSLQKALGEERAKAGELQKASLAEKQRITAQLNQLRAEKEQLTEKWECLQSEYQKQAEGKSRLEEEIQRLAEECEKQKLEQEQYRTQLQAAVNQYNELAEVARQLQIEGKKWRDKYFQETKKRKERSLAAKGKQSGE